MWVQIVRSHCRGGGVDVVEGEKHDIPTTEALRKIKLGWVQACDAPAPPAEAKPAAPAPETKTERVGRK